MRIIAIKQAHKNTEINCTRNLKSQHFFIPETESPGLNISKHCGNDPQDKLFFQRSPTNIQSLEAEPYIAQLGTCTLDFDINL